MQQHELSAAFPRMSDGDFDALKTSIEKIGVQNPAVVYDGKIIDGWHRWQACQRLGVECPTVTMPTDVDPRDYVMAQNKARRHITQAQLAMAATAVYGWRENGENNRAANLRTQCGGSKTTAEIAKSAGVGARSVEQAKTVQTKAAPEVVQAVVSGEMGLKKAAEIAKLPLHEQAAAIDKPLPPKPKKAAEPPPQEQHNDAMAALTDEIAELESENAELRNRIAIEQYDVSEEAKTEAARLIDEQAKRIKNLIVENEALKASRDGFQLENAQLMRQVAMLQKYIKKLEQGVA